MRVPQKRRWLFFLAGCAVIGVILAAFAVRRLHRIGREMHWIFPDLRMSVQTPARCAVGEPFTFLVRIENREQDEAFWPQSGIFFHPDLPAGLVVESTNPPATVSPPTQNNTAEYSYGDSFTLPPGRTDLQFRLRASQAIDYTGEVSLFINQEDGSVSHPLRLVVSAIARRARNRACASPEAILTRGEGREATSPECGPQGGSETTPGGAALRTKPAVPSRPVPPGPAGRPQ